MQEQNLNPLVGLFLGQDNHTFPYNMNPKVFCLPAKRIFSNFSQNNDYNHNGLTNSTEFMYGLKKT